MAGRFYFKLVLLSSQMFTIVFSETTLSLRFQKAPLHSVLLSVLQSGNRDAIYYELFT